MVEMVAEGELNYHPDPALKGKDPGTWTYAVPLKWAGRSKGDVT